MAFEGRPVNLVARVMSFLLGRMMRKAVASALREDLNDIKAAAEEAGTG